MRDISSVNLIAGPLALLAYLIGSLIAGRRPPSHDVIPDDARDLENPRRQVAGPARHGVSPFVEAIAAVAVVNIAWQLTRAVAPGATATTDASRIAWASNQVLTAWQSAAIWAGLALIVGLVAPYAGTRKGSSGLAGSVALLAVYAPLIFSAAMVIFAGAMFLLGSPRAALPAALAGGVVGGWIGWQLEAASLWGLTNGPEVSLWSAILACVLYTRWRKGDVLVTVLDDPA